MLYKNDLDHDLDLRLDCRESGVGPRETLPIRSRPDLGFKEATPASTPATSSTTSISPDRDDTFEVSSASSYDSDTIPQEPRPNARRTLVGATPPSLQRCDYKHRIFVDGLLAVTTSFVETIWPIARQTPRSSTEFNGAGVLSLRTFIQETCRRSKTSYSTLQIALYYLVLLKEVLPDLDFTREQPRESDYPPNRLSTDSQVLLGQPSEPSACRVIQCGRRMFMSALMLAAKYLQDRNLSCKAWARLSGLSCLQVNQNERAYLQSIEYRLHIKKEHFDNWSQIIVELCQSAKLEGSLDYARIMRRLKPEIIHDPVNTKHFLKEIREGRYHAVCSDQSGSFYQDNNSFAPQSIRTPLNSEFMQNPVKPALAAGPNCSQKSSINPRPQAPSASIHTCPPPRPVHRRPSTDAGSQPMQTTPNTKSMQTPFRSMSPNRSSGITVDYSFRFDDETPNTGDTAYPDTQLPPEPQLRVCSTLEESAVCSSLTSPSLPRSAPSSPESVTDLQCAEGAEDVSRSGSSSMLSALLSSSQGEKKAVTDPSPLRRSDTATPDDTDSGYGSHSESHAEKTDSFHIAPWCGKRKAPPGPTPQERTAAATLLTLSKSRVELGIISEAENKMLTGKRASKKRGQPKSLKPGHTSEHAKAKRQKERASSRMDKTTYLALDATTPEIVCSFGSNAWEFEEERESQVGHKEWADARKPVLTQDNPCKRRAQDAPTLAASMLWNDISREMILARSN